MINLPLPPSTNHLFATNWRTKRRFPSEQYEAWQGDAAAEVKRQRPKPLLGCKDIALSIRIPHKTRGDISNRIKAIEDLLVSHNLIDDDRYIQRLQIERDRDVPDGRAVVEWSALGVQE